MRISDWSSDVCSSDLRNFLDFAAPLPPNPVYAAIAQTLPPPTGLGEDLVEAWDAAIASAVAAHGDWAVSNALSCGQYEDPAGVEYGGSEEHTSEHQSLMRNSYAGLCLKKKKQNYK